MASVVPIAGPDVGAAKEFDPALFLSLHGKGEMVREAPFCFRKVI